MEEQRLDRLHPGLPVSDVRGDRIGTLAHVYGRVAEKDARGPSGTTMSEKVVEVRTGLLGLGRHLYVPAQAIETVTDDQVILDRPREDLDAPDWSSRPPDLTQLA
jgi:hypothetical protein